MTVLGGFLFGASTPLVASLTQGGSRYGGAGHTLPFGICLFLGCQPVVDPSFKHDFCWRASY